MMIINRNGLEQTREQFDAGCNQRIRNMNKELVFGITVGQLKELKRLQAKFYIKINLDNVRTMVAASEKIVEIKQAISEGRVKLRPKTQVYLNVTIKEVLS